LTSSQKATLAVEFEPIFAAQAAERQVATLKQNAAKSLNTSETSVREKIHERSEATTVPKRNHRQESQRTAAAKAAAMTGVNRHYVADAKKLKTEDPEELI
jgi:hypothetical protein